MKHLTRSQSALATVTEEPSPVVLRELEVRPLGPEEQARARDLLAAEHYLGAAPPVGRTLTQVVHHHGRWVASRALASTVEPPDGSAMWPDLATGVTPWNPTLAFASAPTVISHE